MARFAFVGKVSAVFALAAILASCTTKKQETPSLTGPSELGTSISISVSPEVLSRNGTSQSTVSIVARGPNGQPLPNASLRAQVYAGGQPVLGTDLGTLSAQSLVTDSNGRASLYYTAPTTPVGTNQNTMVQVGVTAVESDAANATPRFAQIELVPNGGGGGLPTSPFTPKFTPPTVTIGDPAVFTATVIDANGADVSNQVSSFLWNFGDGGTGSGQTVTHTFTTAGAPSVTLTITDVFGRTNYTANQVTVGQGAIPTAQFVFSPAAPVINQVVNFNATLSSATAGHKITDFSWNFGDGSPDALGNGNLVSHTYTVPGSYSVVLKITDDLGRKATATQTVTVASDTPQAKIVMSPSAPSGPNGTAVPVIFDGSSSTVAPGRTIVSYDWTVKNSNGNVVATGSGPTVSGSFIAPGVYSVTLTITDSANQKGTLTQSFTVTAS